MMLFRRSGKAKRGLTSRRFVGAIGARGTRRAVSVETRFAATGTIIN